MIRPIGHGDNRFLRDMLRHAYHARLNADPDRPAYHYVANWGRPGDAGVIAFEGLSPYGVAWYRLFPKDDPGFGWVDEQTPELTIAVVPSKRRQGVGDELLEAALEQARREGHPAVSVSAERRLLPFWERHGFVPVCETGATVTLRREL
jgi:GNAT superfamily N-acetyltransferase